MKKNFTFRKFGFCFDIGWYYGQDFRLLSLGILEITNWRNKVDTVSIFNIQIAKFIIDLFWERQ